MASQPPGERSDHAARSAATRQRLLDVAVEVLAEVGYAGASTLKIQERAGVSRGRLLHQYPHRDELLVAAVQHLADGRIGGTDERTVWPSDVDARRDAAVEAVWLLYHHAYFWAATELWLAARHNEPLRAALAPAEQELGARIRLSVATMFGPDLAEHPNFPATRELLSTSMRGVALTYAFEPRDPTSDPHLVLWRELARTQLSRG